MQICMYASVLLLVAGAAFAQPGASSPPALPSAPPAALEDGAWVMRDLQYSAVGDKPLAMDAYIPADGETHPALLFFHGGGWQGGDKAGWFEKMDGPRLIEAGIAFFSVNYRSAAQGHYPGAVEDALAAVRWVRAYGVELHVDPNRLAVSGRSAGGHLALMVGFLEPEPTDVDAQGRPMANLVRCVWDMYGPVDLTTDEAGIGPNGLAFLGVPRAEIPERYAEASPINHISSDDPPVIIMHGMADTSVPFWQAQALHDKLDLYGVENELLSYRGGGHGLSNIDLTPAIEFLKRHLFAEATSEAPDYDGTEPRGIATATVTRENGLVTMSDIEYGRAGGHGLYLVAYLPDDDQSHPALITFHAGGWSAGDKLDGLRGMSSMDSMISAGIARFSVNYRLSGEAPYPAAVDDCLAAIRWIRAHASELHIDPDRLGAWGGSAGGHLALMIAYLEPGPEDLDAQGDRMQNYLRCVVSISGPTDLAADDMYRTSAVPDFLGVPREQAPQLYAEASPITHVSADDPPTILVHGTADETVPYTQAVKLAAKLAEVGVPCEFYTLEGGGHGGHQGLALEQFQAAMVRATAFVKEHLLEE